MAQRLFRKARAQRRYATHSVVQDTLWCSGAVVQTRCPRDKLPKRQVAQERSTRAVLWCEATREAPREAKCEATREAPKQQCFKVADATQRVKSQCCISHLTPLALHQSPHTSKCGAAHAHSVTFASIQNFAKHNSHTEQNWGEMRLVPVLQNAFLIQIGAKCALSASTHAYTRYEMSHVTALNEKRNRCEERKLLWVDAMAHCWRCGWSLSLFLSHSPSLFLSFFLSFSLSLSLSLFLSFSVLLSL